MTRRHASRAGLAGLILANLFVALQVLRHEWGFYEVMLTCWAEAVLLGGFNVLRMLVVGVVGAAPLGAWAARSVDLGSGLNRLGLTVIAVGFFIVKFAGFALATGLFVLLLPALLAPDESTSNVDFHRALTAAGPGFLAAAGALGLSHAVSFARNFLLGREYDRVNLLELAFWPYARMSLVGGVLLLGVAAARLTPGIGRQALFAAVMVLLKLAADAVSHVAEHRWLADRHAAGEPPSRPPPYPASRTRVPGVAE
jgi:hypothetical protein